MISRRQIEEQKRELKATIRESCRSGALAPGSMAPSLRELAAEFNISKDVVATLRQELVDEGVFQKLPGGGTVVGSIAEAASEFYLMLLPFADGVTKANNIQQTQSGFENALAKRGAASLVLPMREALQARDNGELPAIAGLFDFAYQEEHEERWGSTPGLPRVGFRGRIEPGVIADEVTYDSVDGGRQATRHLWQLGHRRIAFLGLHALACSRELTWSAEREEGWRQILAELGGQPDLTFHPAREPAHTHQGQVDAGYETALALLRQAGPNECSAVVAANDLVAQGLLKALLTEEIPRELWPAVVGFDNLPQAGCWTLTSLSLPGEELGAEAAEMLWARRHGRLTGGPQTRTVNMRVIPRLTSQNNWSRDFGHANLVTSLGGGAPGKAALVDSPAR